MAGSYVLPQVRVFQEFAETPNDVTQNLSPFVIGPNYQLMRYSDADERADCTSGEYKGADLALAWATGITGSVPDTSWYKVTLENAYAQFGALNCTCLDGSVGGQGTKFEFTLTEGKSLIGDDPTKLEFGTPIKPGDYLGYQTGSGETLKWNFTKIKEISCGKLDSGEVTYTLKNKSSGAVYAGLSVDLADYVGEKPVEVKLVLSASSTEGEYGKVTWTSNVSGISGSNGAIKGTDNKLDLGKGLKIYAAANVAAGTYVLKVTLREPYARDTVTTADFVPVTASMSLTFFRLVDAVDAADDFVTLSDTGVTLSAGTTTPIGSTARTIVKATAYLTQRNFVKAHTDGVYSISSDADIIRELGAIVPENPLAYAAHIMLLNCATATIKYIALESDDLEGYSTALDRASVTTDVYAFCPLTENRTIIDAVVAHCNTLSAPEEKSWRIAFFSMPTASSVDVTPNVDGDKEKCKVVTAGNVTTLTCYKRGTTTDETSTVAQFVGTVRAGDLVTVIDTSDVERTAKVVSVTSNNTLTLDTAIPNASASIRPFTIVHEMAKAEYVEAVAATSSSFRDRRAYNVFPNTLRDTDGNYVSGMYGAAAVCALACSVAPQQPITNVEIKGFADLPDVYSKYSRDELNTIAAGGTLILMQEKSGGTVYVRHQISTAYPDGNLNTTELSLTKNLDSISYYFANRFAPYIGRYNLTDDLLTELKGILEDGLAYLETSTETNRLVGPQVLAEGTEIRSLYRSTTEKDKAYADVALNLPAPFNNFDLRLQVI